MQVPVAPVQHILLDDEQVPRTKNRGVKVYMIVQRHYEGGESAEIIAAHYSIGIADVYAALAYYHDNQTYFSQLKYEDETRIQEAQDYTVKLKARIEGRLRK